MNGKQFKPDAGTMQKLHVDKLTCERCGHKQTVDLDIIRAKGMKEPSWRCSVCAFVNKIGQ